MKSLEAPSSYALWVSHNGRFGVMDIVRGEIWHPKESGKHGIRAMHVGMVEEGLPVFVITFIGTKEVSDAVQSGSAEEGGKPMGNLAGTAGD